MDPEESARMGTRWKVWDVLPMGQETGQHRFQGIWTRRGQSRIFDMDMTAVSDDYKSLTNEPEDNKITGQIEVYIKGNVMVGLRGPYTTAPGVKKWGCYQGVFWAGSTNASNHITGERRTEIHDADHRTFTPLVQWEALIEDQGSRPGGSGGAASSHP
jgi:hypothetical protein